VTLSNEPLVRAIWTQDAITISTNLTSLGSREWKNLAEKEANEYLGANQTGNDVV
jgi:hypothetical protein